MTEANNWIHLHVYGDHEKLNLFLKQTFNELRTHLFNQNLIDRWFFVRFFVEKEPNIRFRLHVIRQEAIEQVKKITKLKLDENCHYTFTWKFDSSTYSDKLEPYDSGTITLFENFFTSDSDYFLDLSKILDEKNDPIYWFFALKSTNQLMDDFDLSIHEKIEMLGRLLKTSKSKVLTSKKSQELISEKYVQKREMIEEIFSTQAGINAELAEILSRRTLRNRNIAPELIEQMVRLKKNRDKLDIISCYISLHINRLFYSKPALKEEIIYYFLFRFMQSKVK